MPVLDELKDRLVAQSVGVYGSTIMLGSGAVIPTGNGPYLSLTETGGAGALTTHNGTPVELVTVHVLVRAKSYSVARAMLKAAYDAFGGANGLHNVTLSGTFYQQLKARQNLSDIGLDEEKRRMLVFNVDGMKEPS